MEVWSILALQFLGCIILVSGQSPDLICYKCVTQAGDNTCLENPERVPTTPNFVECEGGWCTTTRKEFTEVPGKIVTFTRGCAKERPELLDNIVHNAHFTTYYSTCRTVRCNNGDGLKQNSGGGGGGGDDTGFIIVEGESSGGSTMKVNLALATISAFFCILITM